MRKNKVQAGTQDVSILAVDDDNIMTVTLQSYFQSSGYQVDIENDPQAAIERVRNGYYDILLLDFLMTPICGDQVVERIREFNSELFIILLTGHKSMAPPIKTIRELDIQGYYEKSERFDQLELLVESCVKSIKQMRTIKGYQDKLNAAYNLLRDNYMETISAIRVIVDAKDIYTRGHSDRVSYYATKLAHALGKDDEYCERVRVAGLFHDIGKLAIADEILLKNSRLTDEEYAKIKTHSENGYNILKVISLFQDIAPIVKSHHERIDGGGYPQHICGEKIPEEARIICIADSFDAMISDRQYRPSLGFEHAVEQLRSGKGTQFDPEFVDVFLELLKNYDEMRKELEWTYNVIPETAPEEPSC